MSCHLRVNFVVTRSELFTYNPADIHDRHVTGPVVVPKSELVVVPQSELLCFAIFLSEL